MQFSKEPNTGTGDMNFVKLKDGESIKGILRGNPYEFHKKWVDHKSTPCDASDPDAKFAFRMNLVVKEESGYVSKILEQGAKLYSSLKELNEEFNLDVTVIKIKRTGEKFQTVYSVFPTSDKFTDSLEKSLLAVELQPLEVELEGDGPKLKQEEDFDF